MKIRIPLDNSELKKNNLGNTNLIMIFLPKSHIIDNFELSYISI